MKHEGLENSCLANSMRRGDAEGGTSFHEEIWESQRTLRAREGEAEPPEVEDGAR